MIFNNSSIKNVCVNLPLTKDELLKVKGFKKAKVSIYGDKILLLVKEYCHNNIELSQQANSIDDSLNQNFKPNSVHETLKHFREGKSIEQVAKERNLVISTIESHFAKAFTQNLIQIDEIMPIDEAKKIAEYFPQELNEVRLTSIKEKTPEDITYGKLRMVFAWL